MSHTYLKNKRITWIESYTASMLLLGSDHCREWRHFRDLSPFRNIQSILVRSIQSDKPVKRPSNTLQRRVLAVLDIETWKSLITNRLWAPLENGEYFKVIYLIQIALIDNLYYLWASWTNTKIAKAETRAVTLAKRPTTIRIKVTSASSWCIGAHGCVQLSRPANCHSGYTDLNNRLYYIRLGWRLTVDQEGIAYHVESDRQSLQCSISTFQVAEVQNASI